MEALKASYKAAKHAHEAEPGNEGLKRKYKELKAQYKSSKTLRDAVAEKSTEDKPPSEAGNTDNGGPEKPTASTNNNMDGSETPEGKPPPRKKAKRRRKSIPGFVPYRKLVAQTLEKHGGPKGMTKAQLRENVLNSRGIDMVSKIEKDYDVQLQKMLDQSKLVVLDGNKVKLYRLLDERAKARIDEAKKAAKQAAKEEAAQANADSYNT